jgi:putative transposase
VFAGKAWFDPIEAEPRMRARGFLVEMIEQEPAAALGRDRYRRGTVEGHYNGTRPRWLFGFFNPIKIAVPRARLSAADVSREWRSAVLRRYAQMTRQVESLIASWKAQESPVPCVLPRIWTCGDGAGGAVG